MFMKILRGNTVKCSSKMVTIKDDYTKGSVNIPFVLSSFFDIFMYCKLKVI